MSGSIFTSLMTSIVLAFATAPMLSAQETPEGLDFSYPEGVEPGFHVFGMESGYFMLNEPVEIVGTRFDSLMFDAPLPECEQYDGGVVLYRQYVVSHMAVDEERYVFRASGEGVPDYEFVMLFDPAGRDAWLDGASSVRHLGYARITLGETSVVTQVGFWLGD